MRAPAQLAARTTPFPALGTRSLVLGSIIVGAIVGLVARLVSSSRAPAGFITSTLLGIAGALLSGFVGHGLGFYATYEGGFLFSVIGSLLLLGIHRIFTKGKRQNTLESG